MNLTEQIEHFRAQARFAESKGWHDAAAVNHAVARMLDTLAGDIAWEVRDAFAPEEKLAWQKVVEHFGIML